MRAWLRKCWPALKVLLALAIVVAVSRRFARDLHSNPDLWTLSVRPGWLAVSGILYILGLSFFGFFWIWLMRGLGQRVPLSVALRAYFVGLLGKYLPGKAWALLLRVALVRGPGIHAGSAAATAFYEVLTSMATGVLLAAAFLILETPGDCSAGDWNSLYGLLRLEAPNDEESVRPALVLLSVVLLAVLGLPVLPGIFNRLLHRLSLPFRDIGAAPLPALGFHSLAGGLILSACGWLFLGASLAAGIEAVLARPPAWTWNYAGNLVAGLGVSYVAGFVILVVPSGLGVREFFLTLFLVPLLSADSALGRDEARALAVLVVLVLRLVWTAAEVLTAGVLYWLPVKSDRMTG